MIQDKSNAHKGRHRIPETDPGSRYDKEKTERQKDPDQRCPDGRVSAPVTTDSSVEKRGKTQQRAEQDHQNQPASMVFFQKKPQPPAEALDDQGDIPVDQDSPSLAEDFHPAVSQVRKQSLPDRVFCPGTVYRSLYRKDPGNQERQGQPE